MDYSADQARARDRIVAVLHAAGVDLAEAALLARRRRAQPTLAVIGKAGSGKTMLLADLVRGLVAAGVETISSDFESRRTRTRRTLAVLAPTNKAASVLRQRGVPATTIHRILYTPLYHPDYEAIAEWLTGKGEPAEGRGADRGGARPGAGVLPAARVDPRGAGQRRAPGVGFHQGLEAAGRAPGHRADRRGLDAGRPAVCRSPGAVPDADPVRRPRAAGAGRAAAAAWCSTTCRQGSAARAPPGAPAGGGQSDPGSGARARRSGAGVSRLRGSVAGEGAARRPGGHRRAGRCGDDGARTGAGLAQRDAGAADQRVPGGVRGAAGRRCCRGSRWSATGSSCRSSTASGGWTWRRGG